MPSKATLRRYIEKMPNNAGISQAALKIIEKKVMQMKPRDRLCSLCLDEISLKTNLGYSVPADKIIGLEDYGCGYRTNKVATSALVLLIRSISGKWKQPIAYYLVNGGCPSDILEDLVQGASWRCRCHQSDQMPQRMVDHITSYPINFGAPQNHPQFQVSFNKKTQH